MRRTALLLTLVGAMLLACAGVVLAQSTEPEPSEKTTSDGSQSERNAGELRVEEPGSGEPGPLSAAQERAINQGYLVPDQDAYEQFKDEAKAEEKQPSGESTSGESALGEGTSSPGSQAPQIVGGWQALFDTGGGPSDSTGAIGPDRYIELVNSKFGIYNRSGTALDTGSLQELVGESSAANVFDPQIIWDPDTNRFFYAADDVLSATDNRLAFGFSKTASPSSAADFCQYIIAGFGSNFPDYPKLGDTQNFLMIGDNTFDSNDDYVGSELIYFNKPGAGSTCPAPSSFTIDSYSGLSGEDNTEAFTPVPANQTDGSGTGHIVAIPGSVFDTGSASKLSVFQATESAGDLLLSVKDLPVPTYSFPSNARQPNTNNRLDTLDTRNTQAVSAFNPNRGEASLWTQHTIFGGAGAAVKWYEIDPSPPAVSVFQSELLSNSGRWVFNGAISPDRYVNGVTKLFGDSMVLNVNTSSSSTFPDVFALSRIGSNATTFKFVGKSSNSLADFTCFGGVCRWGDYAAATPDPAAPTSAAHGQVWHSTQFVRTPGGPSSTGWGTGNFGTKP